MLSLLSNKPHFGGEKVVNTPLKVFVTYSHKNTKAKDQLITRLGLLKRDGIIDIWHDNEILPGDKWHDAIFSTLAGSDLLLYLTSANSLESENCNKELAAALNAEIRVIPIILEHCDWQNHHLSDFQALPDRGLPITKWNDQSDGWQNVVDGIRKAVDETQTQAKPLSESIQNRRLAEWVFQQGNFLMMLKQTNKAIEAYSHAIDLSPHIASSYNNRGVAYNNRVDLDQAIKDFNRAIQLNDNYAEAYYNRGVIYSEKEDFGKAIKNYNKAIEVKPKYAEAYYSRGTAYGIKGDYNCAIADFNIAIQLKTDYTEAYSNRGNAYNSKGEFNQAIKDYTKAIELNPNYADAYYNRGGTWLYLGEREKAKLDLMTARELGMDAITALDEILRDHDRAWKTLGNI